MMRQRFCSELTASRLGSFVLNLHSETTCKPFQNTSRMFSRNSLQQVHAIQRLKMRKEDSLWGKQRREKCNKDGVCCFCKSKLKTEIKEKTSGRRNFMTTTGNIQRPVVRQEVKDESGQVPHYDPSTIQEYFSKQVTHPLDKIFNPKTVAVIGASEKQGSVGRNILWNLMATPFGGTIYPINPKRRNVMGVLAYPSVKSIKEQIDLAVICIPASQVPNAIQECVDAGIKGAIVISAGFSEAGEQGKQWANEMVQIARKGGMRIIGPNCLGVMNPQIGFNATFATSIALPGKVAVISQSGALATAILDFSLRENVGFSSFVSIGGMADVDLGDLIEFLGRDPQTESIIVYMESIGNARSFISAARNVALTKPIIVIKVGRTEQGGKAAASHTGTLTGSDDVLDAAFKRCGVLRVETIEELFYMAQTLAKQPRPRGNRLSIITNAGGPGALSTDALYSNGGVLSELSQPTMEKLNKLLPEHWSRGNPIDVLGDAPPDRYAKTLEIVSKDPNGDALLVILTPQAMSDPTQTAQVLKHYSTTEKKPILASWMGGNIVEPGRRILTQSGIPTFEFPDIAVKVFNYMWKYSNNLQGLYEVPDMIDLLAEVPSENREKATELIERVRSSGRCLLTEYESKMLMNLYGIPTTKILIATNEEEAVKVATQIGYPVVLKIHSETITHKTEVDGVRLNLETDIDVRRAFADMKSKVDEKDFAGVSVQNMVKLPNSYEVIFGSNTDDQIGPTILFGSGGSMVEVYKDTTLGLPPLNTALARNMIHSTHIFKALNGFRGKPKTNLDLLEHLLVRFSQLVTDLNCLVKEIDINPLVVSPTEIVALDARVLVYPTSTTADQIPMPAIRPYPIHHVTSTTVTMGNNTQDIRIRPIRPEDHPKMIQFFENLSENMLGESMPEQALHYVHAFHKLSQQNTKNEGDSIESSKAIKLFKNAKQMWDMLVRLCIGNYDSEIVMIAESAKQNTDLKKDVMALVMYTKSIHDPKEAELAIVVDQKYQNYGLGTLCLEHLLKVAKIEGVEHMYAYIPKTNLGMQRLCKKYGFNLSDSERECTAHLRLK